MPKLIAFDDQKTFLFNLLFYLMLNKIIPWYFFGDEFNKHFRIIRNLKVFQKTDNRRKRYLLVLSVGKLTIYFNKVNRFSFADNRLRLFSRYYWPAEHIHVFAGGVLLKNSVHPVLEFWKLPVELILLSFR